MTLGSLMHVNSRLHFALDFDGTICPIDTTDFLLESFAEPEWRAIEDRWQAGEISSRACLAAQVALIRASEEEVRRALATVTLDPDVPLFVDAARRYGADVSVVSDGFDVSLLPLLAAAGLDLPVTCNQMLPVGENRWAARFSNGAEGCGSGTCKCAATGSRQPLVLIGDGRSDFCLARRADFVFAKGSLAAFCVDESLPHLAITGFADVLAFLPALIAEMSPTLPVSTGTSFEDLNA
ncbi:2,3-diketo-5-methylthio-1-phosphopentane phosphatase [Ancylobacter sp. 3268]|uniref:HAD-IB family phosphatase n=1 Tax=Ancylobacter sp. 3268 TaxID=2817752 RepID=UPI0028594409|nr:HAD-IB family phosphatase [Ancylobacter sp. 3268]MDR6953307.1 2,3-diketo-5-methylthio-1-phosphopentane phosphatase [Ancylobacter sp. 3268]